MNLATMVGACLQLLRSNAWTLRPDDAKARQGDVTKEARAANDS